jgi:uncharacterized damage-inducible protein DinB
MVPSITGAPPMTSHAELLYGDFAQEHASTRRVLQRYPDGKGEWRPHEKSRALAPLATHVADIINRGTTVLETDSMDIIGRQPLPPIDSARGLVEFFDASLARFNAALAASSDGALARPWAIRRGDKVLAEQPRRVMLRTLMMNHLVHHRAQLGVYYRLLGVPVPGVYGPSADEAI